MIQQIDITEAKAHLSELLEQALQGNEILITEGDTPLVKLLPVFPIDKSPASPRKAGSARGKIRMADDFDTPMDDFSEEL